ncbi:MAG: zinc-ribbon domain-containing protein [Myxococcales bacterium]|nr:zinc-ribbon domain-containing protein [Myxococcales bacterium]
MKIVCESCSAKYSIADEKVVGKVFKIRCKRCSEVIIVRGDGSDDASAPASMAPSAASYDSSAAAIWHVVIDGEQAGPYTPAQLGEMINNQTIDWETYAWAEGFDNWAPIRDVQDLVDQITNPPAQQPAAQAAYASAGADALTAQPSMGADPFADDGGGAGGMFGGGAGSDGPDLFGGGGASSPFDSPGGSADAGVVSSSPSPRVSSEQAMTGARNENSVLFSLKNLQALATGSSSVAPSPSSDGAPGGSAGFASGDASGLIDIRALAGATGMSDEGGGGGEAKDELLSMGSQAGGFGALGSPMLAAPQEEPEGNKKTLALAVVAGFAFLSIAAVGVAFILKPEPAPPAPIAAVAPAAAAAAAAAPAQPAAPGAEEKKDEELSEGAKAAAEAAKEEEDKDDKSDSSSSRKRRRRGSGDDSSGSSSGSSSGGGSADDSKSTASAPSAPAKPSGSRSLDDLLGAALTGGGKKSGGGSSSAPAANANLPKQPSRSEVISAMNGVKGAVQACAGGASGTAMVNITVAGSTGRVTSAQVSGVTGAPGSCIAKAVRKAKFPKFSQSVFKVNFPFRL